MSVLEWDKSGERLYETGVDHGVLYVSKTIVEPGAKTRYGKGVVWNGLTGVTNSPDGAEPNDLWADNIKYGTLRSAETFGATIEAYNYPNEFGVCNGLSTPIPGVNIGQQSRRAFSFVYRTNVGSDTDTNAIRYKLHIIYNATCSPSEQAYETINDSPDALTFNWEITTSPMNCSGFKPVSEIVIDTWKLTPLGKEILESVLFGTELTDPYLPDPNDLLALYIDYIYHINDQGHLILENKTGETDVSFEFDEDGHLIYEADANSDVQFSINSNGHLIMEVA